MPDIVLVLISGVVGALFPVIIRTIWGDLFQPDSTVYRDPELEFNKEHFKRYEKIAMVGFLAPVLIYFWGYPSTAWYPIGIILLVVAGSHLFAIFDRLMDSRQAVKGYTAYAARRWLLPIPVYLGLNLAFLLLGLFSSYKVLMAVPW